MDRISPAAFFGPSSSSPCRNGCINIGNALYAARTQTHRYILISSKLNAEHEMPTSFSGCSYLVLQAKYDVFDKQGYARILLSIYANKSHRSYIYAAKIHPIVFFSETFQFPSRTSKQMLGVSINGGTPSSLEGKKIRENPIVR